MPVVSGGYSVNPGGLDRLSSRDITDEPPKKVRLSGNGFESEVLDGVLDGATLNGT